MARRLGNIDSDIDARGDTNRAAAAALVAELRDTALLAATVGISRVATAEAGVAAPVMAADAAAARYSSLVSSDAAAVRPPRAVAARRRSRAVCNVNPSPHNTRERAGQLENTRERAGQFSKLPQEGARTWGGSTERRARTRSPLPVSGSHTRTQKAHITNHG